MPSPFADDAARDAFLADPRLAILMTHRTGKGPMGVPVWFDWSGGEVHMFAAKDSAKVRRLQADPRVSVLVTNRVGEQESWVAFDGDVEIREDGGLDLANRLAPRYWDLNNPNLKATLDNWRQAPEAFCLLTMTPSAIRSGA